MRASICFYSIYTVDLRYSRKLSAGEIEHPQTNRMLVTEAK